MLAFGGVITKQVLFSPKVTIPQFLLDTRKPIKVIRQINGIVNLSATAGNPKGFRTRLTTYIVKGVRPEELIERLSSSTNVKDEVVTYQTYFCSLGDQSYMIAGSRYVYESGSSVEVLEKNLPVSSTDLWASGFVRGWTDLRFGKVNVPVRLSYGMPLTNLDLKRIRRARPNVEIRKPLIK